MREKREFTMPVYDYRCRSCDYVFELERPLGYLDDEACPQCGSVSKRVFQVYEEQPELGGGSCSTHSNMNGILADMESLLAEG